MRLRRRSASLDTAATANGRQLRGGRGRSRAQKPPKRARLAHDRRAISVPLARVTRGQPGSLETARDARSAPLAAVTAALPKLIVRVRFPSPAPRRRPRPETVSPARALLVGHRVGAAGPLAAISRPGPGRQPSHRHRRAGSGWRGAARPGRLRSAGRRCWACAGR
jgi:hypothetical protein